jgi:hypothetical protein
MFFTIPFIKSIRNEMLVAFLDHFSCEHKFETWFENFFENFSQLNFEIILFFILC